jgi:hypothetical protein
MPQTYSSVICLALSVTISGTFRYSVIFPVTQIRFPLYSLSGVPNLLRFSPQISTLKT